MMFFKRMVAVAALGMLAAVAAAPAQAGTYSQCGTSCNTVFDVNYGFDTGSGTVSATSTWQIKQFTSSVLELWITMTNTTQTTGNGTITQSSILSYGVGTDPDTVVAFATNGQGAVFDFLADDVNFPGGYHNVDICVYAANGCSGGAINDGLINQGGSAFASDMVKLLITPTGGGSFGSSIVLDPYPIKWQTNNGSFETTGNECCVRHTAPEPGMIGLLGSGLLALYWQNRRRVTARL